MKITSTTSKRAEVCIDGRTYIANVQENGILLREKGMRGGEMFSSWADVLRASSLSRRADHRPAHGPIASDDPARTHCRCGQPIKTLHALTPTCLGLPADMGTVTP